MTVVQSVRPTHLLLLGQWSWQHIPTDVNLVVAALKPALQQSSLLVVDQKQADKIFRDINIEINGFYFLNYLAYWALRLFGWFAWNGHRKRNLQIGD